MMNFTDELAAFQQTHPFKTKVVDGYTFRYLLCGNQQAAHTLAYFVGGTGNPLGWFRHVTFMEKEYRILLCDYPMGMDTMEGMVHLIAKLVTALGIDRAVWIGASLGGYVAQLLAKFYPEKTDALVLYAASSLTEQGIRDLKKQYSGMKAVVWAMEHIPYNLLKFLTTKPALLHMIPKDCPREERAYLKSFVQWIYEEYTWETDMHITHLMVDLVNVTPVTAADYTYITGRTLLVLPVQDKAFTPEMQQDLMDTLQGAKIRRVEGGHLATLSRAEVYGQYTREFLQGL